MTEDTYLKFSLDVVDEWPPVVIESIPVRRMNGAYEVLHPPLFLKNISVKDVIDVTLNTEGNVESWRHCSRSDHSTIWLLRLSATTEIDDCLASVRALGCLTVAAGSIGCYSIDVGGEVSLDVIDQFLNELNPEQVAVAFPSLRHSENT